MLNVDFRFARALRSGPGGHHFLQIVSHRFFRRARRAGFTELQHERIGDAAAAHGEQSDAVRFRSALKNQRVQILNFSCQLRLAAQHIVQLFQLLVNYSGFLKIQLRAGGFSVLFQAGAQGIAGSFKKRDKASDFHVVLFFCAAGKAGCQAHFHFRIQAAGKSRIAPYFDLAATHFKEIEKFL